jgi:hypothetical protein
MTFMPAEDIADPIRSASAELPGSRLASLARSPGTLAALTVLYAVLPSLIAEGGERELRLRILAAGGALLGAIPALMVARRVARRWHPAVLLIGGILGAVLLVGGVASALGDRYGIAEAASWAVSFPALSYAASATLLLLGLRSAEPDHAALPTMTALALTAFGVVPLVNAISVTRGIYWFPEMSRYWVLSGGGLALFLLATSRWLPERVDRITSDLTAWIVGVRPRAFLIVVGLVALVGSAVLAVICFARQPHNADEVAQLWQARILLAGRLSLPADPNPEFFGMDNVIDRGRWFAQFPVGGPAFLAVGLAMRAAWLVNPILLACTVPPLYTFARRAYGEGIARASVLLLAFSPMVLFMAASFMNHVPVLWLVCVALAQLAVWVDAERRADAMRAAALIGLALGTAAAIRPLDAAIAAVVIGVVQLTGLRGGRSRVESLAVQMLAGAIPVALLLWANARTTGAPLRFGYDVLYGNAHQLGFHVDPYGVMHTPLRAVMYASKYLIQLDADLLESPLPAVGLIVAGLFLLRRPSRWDLMLIGFLVLQLAAYALYWHEGEFRGPRFLFTALPAILILLARAPSLVAAATRGTIRRAALLLLPVCAFAGWGSFNNDLGVIQRIRGYRSVGAGRRVDPDMIARAAGLRHALVFVREGSFTAWQRRLWALGVPRSDAMRLMTSVPPCAMREAIAEEERSSVPDSARLGRLMRTLSRVGEAKPTPACKAELNADYQGVASYAPFLPANTIGPDGRVGGDVVYVLDLGPHNEALRARFGDRAWYRFGTELRQYSQ